MANNLFENNGRNVLDEGDNDTSDSRRGRSQAAGQVVAAAVTAAVIVSVIIGFLMP